MAKRRTSTLPILLSLLATAAAAPAIVWQRGAAAASDIIAELRSEIMRVAAGSRSQRRLGAQQRRGGPRRPRSRSR